MSGGHCQANGAVRPRGARAVYEYEQAAELKVGKRKAAKRRKS